VVAAAGRRGKAAASEEEQGADVVDLEARGKE
jgi:hypothetical protein